MSLPGRGQALYSSIKDTTTVGFRAMVLMQENCNFSADGYSGSQNI